MRKLFALIAVLGMLTIGASKLMAQEDEAAPAAQTEQTTVSIDDEQIESTSLHAAIKQKFIEVVPIHGLCCIVFDLRFGYRYRKSYLLEPFRYEHKKFIAEC